MGLSQGKPQLGLQEGKEAVGRSVSHPAPKRRRPHGPAHAAGGLCRAATGPRHCRGATSGWGHAWGAGLCPTCSPASEPLLLEAHVAAPRLAQQAADAEWWCQLHRHRPQPAAGKGEASGGCRSLLGQLGGSPGHHHPGEALPSPYPNRWVRVSILAPCRGHPVSPGSPGLCPTWLHLPAVVEVEDEVRPWGGGKEKLSEGPAVLSHVAGHSPSPGAAVQGRDRTSSSTRTSPNPSLASASPSLAPEPPHVWILGTDKMCSPHPRPCSPFPCTHGSSTGPAGSSGRRRSQTAPGSAGPAPGPG